MHILNDTTDCPQALKGACLAIGNFDGVHRGHQAVLRTAMEQAAKEGKSSGAMTFEPHPRQYFQPDKAVFRLTPEPLKLRLLAAMGIDLAVVLPFGAELAEKPAAMFVEEILVGNLAVSHVVTGHDFHFGKGRDGNPEVLEALGKTHGFGVTIVEPQSDASGVFSSSRIRDHLREGDPRAAADDLGYWWRVAGAVTGGDKRGHGLGFPTANISVPEGFALKHGIYAVRVHTTHGRFLGAAYLGTRPTFDDGNPLLETFLFDFEGDLYGQEIELEIIAFLREDETFESPEKLAKQMKADCERARALLEGLESDDPFATGLLGA